MKKSLLLLFIFTCSLVYGQGIEFFHGTFEQALAKAKTEQKQIFVDVYTSWCGPCKMMAKNVFTRKEVGDYFNAKFVCLQLDAEKEKEHGFFKHYQANGFPSFFWLNAKGELLDTKVGYADAPKFLEQAKDAQSSNLNAQLLEGRARWEKGERTPELVREYVLGVLGRIESDKVKPCMMEYFATQNTEQMKTEENYKFLRMFMRGVEDTTLFKIFFENAEIYQNYEQGDKFWVNMYRMVVRYGIALRTEPERYQEYLGLLDRIGGPLTDMYQEILGMENTLFQGNFEKGIPMAMALTGKYQTAHPYLGGHFFYTLIIAGYFDKAPVVDSQVKQVITWADDALRAKPCKENLLYLAAAYAKGSDYQKAYQLMANEPFFPEPVLSNALFPKLGIPVVHREYVK